MKLNDFFSNDVINLKILKFENFDLLSENIGHPTLKAIVKYRKHSSGVTIASKFIKECFSFNATTIEDAIKGISMLDSSKAIQVTEIKKKFKKNNTNSFTEEICAYFNESIGKEKLLFVIGQYHDCFQEEYTCFKK